MSGLAEAIGTIYRQVRAPEWAARNLDALADVLRDLSWLPDGPVDVDVPDLTVLGEIDAVRLDSVVLAAATESAEGPRPVRLHR